MVVLLEGAELSPEDLIAWCEPRMAYFAIPRYIATAGGKIPMHRSNVLGRDGDELILRKPWNGEEVRYPDADMTEYEKDSFSFARY